MQHVAGTQPIDGSVVDPEEQGLKPNSDPAMSSNTCIRAQWLIQKNKD